ncbi:MAG TPA: Fe-S cluster assembly protein SufD [Candidatus Binatia bacterium]
MSEYKEQYAAAFKRQQTGGTNGTPPWLSALRESGMSSFDALGFPTSRNEDWKYTSLEPLAAQNFASANGEAKNLRGGEIFARSMIDPEAPRLVFINGRYSAPLSDVGKSQGDVAIQSLAEFIKRNDRSVAAQLGRYAKPQGQAFTALNTAFLDDGAVISIPANRRVEQPIYLGFVSTAPSQPVVSYPRTLILLGTDSEAKIVESYLGINGSAYFCNAVTELVGDAGAVVEHVRLQQECDDGFHIGTLAANLARGCHLTAHALSLSGGLVRNNVHVILNGEGAACVLNGLYLADGKQHIDNFTEIEHARPRASSLELYKGILGGSAHGVFNGKIIVHKDAQKSDARQTNKNLLLSANAMVNTKPQLEIYADDVKCSHGSTIGQIDADAMFYLRSRGLDIEQARSMLSFAFASDVVGRIKIASLRERLDEYLVGRFGRW